MGARKSPHLLPVRARPTRALAPSARACFALPTLAALPLLLSTLGCRHEAREPESMAEANAPKITRDPCAPAPADAPSDAGAPPAPPSPDPPDLPGKKADVRPRPLVADAFVRDGRARR
jgi:hypothetical protein